MLSAATKMRYDFRDLEHYARFAKKPGEQTRKVRAGVLLDDHQGTRELLSERRSRPGSQSTAQDGRLRQRQQQVSDATRKLQEELRKGEQMPQLGGEPMQSLENARQSMERAGQASVAENLVMPELTRMRR